MGLERTSTTTLGYGLPPGGTLLTNTTVKSHYYQLPFWTNYNSNCVCLCPFTNGYTYNSQPLVAGPYIYPTNNPYYNPSLALINTNTGLANTNKYNALSFLCSGGGTTFYATIAYADGTTQGPVSFGIPNWFNATATNTTVTPSASFAYTAQSRCNPAYGQNDFTLNSGQTSGSRLWAVDIALSDTSSAATNLTFSLNALAANASVICAVSGSTNAVDSATDPEYRGVDRPIYSDRSQRV